MGRTATKHARVRLSLEVAESVKDRIDSLIERSDAESMSEVIRRALAVYDKLVDNQSRGGVTILRGKDGREQEVLLSG